VVLKLGEEQVNKILLDVADKAVERTAEILAANEVDLKKMSPDDPRYDRLRLTPERIAAIADDMRKVASLPSPVGQVLKERTLPNGLELKRVSVPFGVIGVIYEARPNVSFDVFSLCLKAGSACVLKGGSDAEASNKAIVALIRSVLNSYGVDKRIVELLPVDREATNALLTARGYVDLIIPRGSSGLINFVRANATIPVIETGAGVCHTYFDASGDLEKGVAIVNNAKTRRVSVCNALDCLLVHTARLGELAALCAPLQKSNVKIYADDASYGALAGSYPAELLFHATADSYGTEYLSYAMAVKCVHSADEAVEHIAAYGSGHSECVVAQDEAVIELFTLLVDAACVYANAPTSFTDGAQFGLGAEIGISTQKLHARGPMALEEITTYKWLIRGEGQVRN
jgi:glutamate-5-semialdehyde dehydrogenase